MKIKKIYYISIVGILLFFVIKVIVKATEAFHQQIPPSERAITEYRNLFPKNVRNGLSNIWSYNNTNRNQFSLFGYGKDIGLLGKRYGLLVYELSTQRDFSLNDISTSINCDRLHSIGGVFVGINGGFCKFDYRSGKPAEIKSITLLFEGDSLLKLPNDDSIISYYYLGNIFAISYNGKTNIDISCETQNPLNKKMPFDISIIKRNNNFFLMVLTVNDWVDTLPKNELNKMLYSSLLAPR